MLRLTPVPLYLSEQEAEDPVQRELDVKLRGEEEFFRDTGFLQYKPGMRERSRSHHHERDVSTGDPDQSPGTWERIQHKRQEHEERLQEIAQEAAELKEAEDEVLDTYEAVRMLRMQLEEEKASLLGIPMGAEGDALLALPAPAEPMVEL